MFQNTPNGIGRLNDLQVKLSYFLSIAKERNTRFYYEYKNNNKWVTVIKKEEGSNKEEVVAKFKELEFARFFSNLYLFCPPSDKKIEYITLK